MDKSRKFGFKLVLGVTGIVTFYLLWKEILLSAFILALITIITYVGVTVWKGKKVSINDTWNFSNMLIGRWKKVKTDLSNSGQIQLSHIETITTTGLLALVTSGVGAYVLTSLFIWIGAIDENTFLSIINFWFFAFLGALWLIIDPRTLGPLQNELLVNDKPVNSPGARMLPVPVNNAAICLWLKSRVKWCYFSEGALWVPWWLGFSVSTAPVSETKVQLHDEKGHPLPEENRGHFRLSEALGYVFIGKRTIQEVVVVQSSDLIKVTADANSVIRVVDPVKWQGADNPYGTMIGRLEGSLRMAIAAFHAEDANLVRSLFPSLIMGEYLMYIQVQKDSGPYIKGDLVRKLSGTRMVKKTEGKPTADDIRQYLDEVNAICDPECKPESGNFTEATVEILEVSVEYQRELIAYGAKKESMVIKDITLPEGIEKAAERAAIERREQVAELIQADTNYQVAEKHAQALDKFGAEAVTMAMVDREKAKLVVGLGPNPIAQAFGLFNKEGDGK